MHGWGPELAFLRQQRAAESDFQWKMTKLMQGEPVDEYKMVDLEEITPTHICKANSRHFYEHIIRQIYMRNL
jgi:hypothetical protein